jgi:hypothetical protein
VRIILRSLLSAIIFKIPIHICNHHPISDISATSAVFFLVSFDDIIEECIPLNDGVNGGVEGMWKEALIV